MRSLRFPDETDAQFRERAERAARIARLLVESCLRNKDIQRLIADPGDPHTEESLRCSPIVRIDYEQAMAIATIGSGLAATKHKNWGEGPFILPLEPDDPVDGSRIIYAFKPNSLYNRRFHQRRRMKRLLGRQHRKLVEEAKRVTQGRFLEELNEAQRHVIERIFKVDCKEFWRACRGKTFLDLPPELWQQYFEFMADEEDS